MKNFLYISLLAASSVFITSCEREDDANFEAPNYLAGKWVPMEIGTVDEDNMVMYAPYQNDAECDVDNMVLYADNTFTFSDFEYSDSACENNSFTGTYRRDANTLILVTMGEDEMGNPVEVEITRNLVSLSYDTMEISYTDEATEEITFLKLQKVD